MRKITVAAIVVIASLAVLCPGALIMAQAQSEKPFQICGWYKWGGIEKECDARTNTVVFNGSTNGNKTMGINIAGDLSSWGWGGRILKIHVEGSSNSIFTDMKMLKIEVNATTVLQPQEKKLISLAHSAYVIAGDGDITYNLPISLNKIDFSFYGATLKDLRFQVSLLPRKAAK